MTDVMNVLPTRIPTRYLLLPYCGWLCYGKWCGVHSSLGDDLKADGSYVPQRGDRLQELGHQD